MMLRLDHTERVMMRMVVYLSAVSSIVAAAKVRCNHTLVKRKADTNYAAAIKDGVLGPDVTIEQDSSVSSCSGTSNALYYCDGGGGNLDTTKQNNLITWTFPNTDYLSKDYKMEISARMRPNGADETDAAIVFTRDDDQLEYVGLDFAGSHKLFISGVEWGNPSERGDVFAHDEWFNIQIHSYAEFMHGKDYQFFKLFVNGKEQFVKSFGWKADAISLRPQKAEFMVNYWMDVTNSVVTGQTVKLGDEGATECPAGFAPVLTATDCEAAMPGETVTFADLHLGPAGCFKTGNTLHFNLSPDAANSQSGNQMVCYGQEPGATDCAIEDMATITAVDTADVATITDRFAQMSSEITDLQQQVTDVDTEISEVEGLATQTASHFQAARTKIAQIKNVSDVNANKSAALEAMAEKYTERVNNASSRLAEVQKVVKTLEEDALELGTQSSSMGSRVAALEDEVDKMLPGVGGIESRLGAAETQVSNLRAEVASGNLEDTIKTSLRGHFARATKHVQDLTDQVILEEAKKAADSR